MSFFPEAYSANIETGQDTYPALPIYQVETQKLMAHAAPSSVSSMARSSMSDHTERPQLSSPPTSHPQTLDQCSHVIDLSPLRPSRAANVKRHNDTSNVVPSSEPASPVKSAREVLSDSEPEEAASQTQSSVSIAEQLPKRVRQVHDTLKAQAFIGIPLSAAADSRSIRSKRKSDGQEVITTAQSTETTMDDASLAAALAREEALGVRRSARASRSTVAYVPSCDADGRPLQARSDSKPSTSAKASTEKTRSRNLRKTRSFSDDEEEDADATDDDLPPQRKAKADPSSTKAKKRTPVGANEIDEDDVVTKVRKLRKGSKADQEEPSHQDADRPRRGKKTKPATESKAVEAESSTTKPDDEAVVEEDAEAEADTQTDDKQVVAEATKEEKPPSQSEATSNGSPLVQSDPPVMINIKRIAERGNPASPSTSSRSSPIPSGSRSPGPASFFGKPLTSLLQPGATRRPGLMRKTNIPSLLNHRGAPKARVTQLAASKRKMQDDDYEYDPVYEAMIAKKSENSDSEGEQDDTKAPLSQESVDEAEADVEYD